MKANHFKYLVLAGMALLLAGVLAACGPTAPQGEATPCPECAPCPEASPCPECPVCEECPEQEPCPEVVVGDIGVPYAALWAGSGHADAEAGAFTHWNEDDPQVVEIFCAKCHSGLGFEDYLGADGSAQFSVEVAPPVGTVVTCTACHNDAAASLSTVMFPSGAVVEGLGSEAVCMTCHQGMASKVQVDEAVAEATDEDTVVAELGFTNIHYYAAAVARYGTIVKGGYEYEGQIYDAKWDHVQGVQSCTDCHNPHSLELELESCASCHPGATDVEGVRAIRMASSTSDYDGDGDVEEGIYDEIVGLQELLLGAIQAYASETAGTPLVYSKDAYPYFFIDTNADGQPGEDETIYPNLYASWTPRLLKAAYNYQTSLKDPGAYVHGGKYIIQLLHDSIVSLNEKLAQPVDLALAEREDPGHFAGSSESFRHWDGEEDGGVVPRSCSKCHTGAGLPQFIAEGVNTSLPAGDALLCESCHSDLVEFGLYEVETVTFPSGAKLGFEGSTADNICLNCHQGRESTVSVNNAIKDKDLDTVAEGLTFRNVHYFAAGSTVFGTEAKGVYEYAGKTYAGIFAHPGLETCTSCHDAHVLKPDVAGCLDCHNVEDVAQIRMNSKGDYDGDGDVTEGLQGEGDTLAEALYAEIQKYATDVAGTPLVYSSSAYPYFFIDTNADGKATPDETIYPNQYVSWTPRLLQAAYNYQYYLKDPGWAAHNPTYILQVLYDSIEDLSTKTGGQAVGERP